MSIIKNLNIETENGIAKSIEIDVKIGLMEATYSAKEIDGSVEVYINGQYIDTAPISYQEELRVNDLYEAIANEINETIDDMPVHTDHIPETYAQYLNERLDAVYTDCIKVAKANELEAGDVSPDKVMEDIEKIANVLCDMSSDTKVIDENVRKAKVHSLCKELCTIDTDSVLFQMLSDIADKEEKNISKESKKGKYNIERD